MKMLRNNQKRRNHKKFKHELKRRSIRQFKKLYSFKRKISKRIFHKSNFLDFLYKNKEKRRFPTKLILKDNVLKLRVPKRFCLITNAEESLKFLDNFVEALRCNANYKRVEIDHSECIEIDLGASLVMDIIMKEANQEWLVNKLKRSFSGIFPNDINLRNLLCGTGLIKNLGLNKKYPVISESLDKYLYFPLTYGKRAGVVNAIESVQKDKVSEDIALYFDQCFRRAGKQLTEFGLNHITRLIGEVLDNVEQHNCDHHWYILSYLDQNKYDDQISECRVAIFNLGNSIYETLSTEETSPELKVKIERLVSSHLTKGLFSPSWDQEALWTLYALQQGVSRFFGKVDGKDRGTGTVNMINFFQKLCGTSNSNLNPEMVLISGSSLIKFDQKYLLKDELVDGELFKIIAFNSRNNLEDKPDKNNVRKLRYKFPGTILSLKFYFDKQYLDNFKAKKNE